MKWVELITISSSYLLTYLLFTQELCWPYKREGGEKSYLLNIFFVADGIVTLQTIIFNFDSILQSRDFMVNNLQIKNHSIDEITVPKRMNVDISVIENICI